MMHTEIWHDTFEGSKHKIIITDPPTKYDQMSQQVVRIRLEKSYELFSRVSHEMYNEFRRRVKNEGFVDNLLLDTINRMRRFYGLEDLSMEIINKQV